MKDSANKVAQCDLCGQSQSFKTTVSNLRKHLERRHPTVSLPKIRDNIAENSTSLKVPPIDTPSTSSSVVRVDETPGCSFQISNHFISQPKKIPESQKRKFDKLLLDLFITDYQPFSVVDDKGFKNFVSALNPGYQLPNRKTISNSMIPAEYEKCMNVVKQELLSVTSVCLTTDSWTSVNNESYLAVTVHYVTDNFQLKSILLECSKLSKSHTSANLAQSIKNIIDKFHLGAKVLIIVSDNASNIVGAVVNELKMKHFGCFAHTINLILQDGLKVVDVKVLVERVKSIVSFFKRSSTGNEQLKTAQSQLGLEPKKLIKEVPTRWNSLFYMIERIVELKNPVKTTIALINKDVAVLTEEEWVVCEELATVLRPFEEVTRNMSGEQYTTASQLIGLKNCLLSVCEKMLKENYSYITKAVLNSIMKGLQDRLCNLEQSKTIALTTLLDPRFKLAVFSNCRASESIKTYCIELMAAIWNKKNTQTTSDSQNVTTEEVALEKSKFSVWEDLDTMISKKKPTGNFF